MVTIRPFQGFLYNKDKIEKFEEVVTPPYDIISESAQKRYYEIHPYNIIRIVLGKSYPKDNEKSNVYTRAKEYFDDLASKEVLIRDEAPALYLYLQEFKLNGKKFRRLGLICRVKIEEYKNQVILPHEATLKKPKEDRFNLIKNTSLNLCPVFGLYEDEGREIEKYLEKYLQEEPIIKFTDEYEITHSLWRLEISSEIEDLEKLFADKKVLIADGHHRYEVALKYKKYLLESGEKNEALNYTMFCLTGMEDPGLVILPIHRLIKNISGLEGLEAALENNFELEKITGGVNLKKTSAQVEKIIAEKGDKSPSFAIIRQNNEEILIISIKPEKKHFNCSKDYLDVSILHNLVFKEALGFTSEENEDNIKYTKEALKVFEEVNRGSWQAGFILNSTPISQIKEVAFSGTLMPQKSTYFFPKLLSGLVINKIL